MDRNHSFQKQMAKSAGAVEYTNYICVLEGGKTYHNECSGTLNNQ